MFFVRQISDKILNSLLVSCFRNDTHLVVWVHVEVTLVQIANSVHFVFPYQPQVVLFPEKLRPIENQICWHRFGVAKLSSEICLAISQVYSVGISITHWMYHRFPHLLTNFLFSLRLQNSHLQNVLVHVIQKTFVLEKAGSISWLVIYKGVEAFIASFFNTCHKLSQGNFCKFHICLFVNHFFLLVFKISV